MAQNRGTFSALYDNVDKVVFGLVGTTLKEIKPIWRQYFRVESSDRKFERRTSLAGFTNVPEKSEGDDYTTQQIRQGHTADFTHLEFGLAFEVTETAQEDDQYGVISDYATMLARAARVTEETYAARQFNLGFTTATSPDGEPAFDAAHPLVTGGTGSNLTTGDLSRLTLQTALTLMHTDAKSEEGFFMQPTDGYILEVHPSREFTAHRIVESRLLPGSADNDTNAVRDRYNISVLVNPYISGTDDWRIIAKNKMHGLLSYTRVPIGMKDPVTLPRSGNRLYKLRFRRSWGRDRWQGEVASAGA